MPRAGVVSALAIVFAVSGSAQAEKAGATTQLKIKCQAQWAALTVAERNSWTVQTYLTACTTHKPVPVHGGPVIKP